MENKGKRDVHLNAMKTSEEVNINEIRTVVARVEAMHLGGGNERQHKTVASRTYKHMLDLSPEL